MHNDRKHSSSHSGFTLIEFIVAISIIAIPIAAVSVLLAGTSRSWQAIYDDTHSQIRQDSLAVTASLQNMGRQANITNYHVYKIKNGLFLDAVPPAGQEIASGQAVEFRYWQQDFNPTNPPAEIFEIDNTGTHYALYYLDGDKLKLDLGKVVNAIGAVNNNSRQTDNILSTQTLASQIDTSTNDSIFSHTLSGGQGNGCVNTSIVLKDSAGQKVEIKFATLLREAWPR